MYSSNQRSIYQSIQKVVGSPNRGFVSPDPERQQPMIVTKKSTAAPTTAADLPPVAAPRKQVASSGLAPRR